MTTVGEKFRSLRDFLIIERFLNVVIEKKSTISKSDLDKLRRVQSICKTMVENDQTQNHGIMLPGLR